MGWYLCVCMMCTLVWFIESLHWKNKSVLFNFSKLSVTLSKFGRRWKWRLKSLYHNKSIFQILRTLKWAVLKDFILCPLPIVGRLFFWSSSLIIFSYIKNVSQLHIQPYMRAGIIITLPTERGSPPCSHLFLEHCNSSLTTFLQFWRRQDSNPGPYHEPSTSLTRYQLSCPDWM